MAVSILERERLALEKVNDRVDVLLENILLEVRDNGSYVEPKTMTTINKIIADIEKTEFHGDVELLQKAVDIYQKAIDVIDDQLKSEEIKGFDKETVKTLEEAKKLFEEQSKEGTVGTIFEKVEELTEAEKSGDMEKRYNDNKIRGIDRELKGLEEDENLKYEPYDQILIETRVNRKQVEKLKPIIDEIEKLNNEIKDLKEELKKVPDDQKQDIENRIKEKEEKIKSTALKAKEEKDNKGDYEQGESEPIDDYITRVLTLIKNKNEDYINKTIADIRKIGNKDINYEGKIIKISDYLKDYIQGNKDIAELSNKIEADMNYLGRQVEKSDEHKRIEELKDEKEEYKRRNANIRETSRDYGRVQSHVDNNQEEHELTEYEEGGWFRRKFNSIKNWFKRVFSEDDYEVEQTARATIGNDRNNIKKRMLEETEKEVKNLNKNNDIFKKYNVDEKDRVSSHIETKINKEREEVYRRMYGENSNEDDGRDQ